MLALDALKYMCEDEIYAKLVLDQSSRPEGYGYSFVKLAKAVMLLLLDFFEAGKPRKKWGARDDDFKQAFMAHKLPTLSSPPLFLTAEDNSEAYTPLLFCVTKKSAFFEVSTTETFQTQLLLFGLAFELTTALCVPTDLSQFPDLQVCFKDRVAHHA